MSEKDENAATQQDEIAQKQAEPGRSGTPRAEK